MRNKIVKIGQSRPKRILCAKKNIGLKKYTTAGGGGSDKYHLDWNHVVKRSSGTSPRKPTWISCPFEIFVLARTFDDHRVRLTTSLARLVSKCNLAMFSRHHHHPPRHLHHGIHLHHPQVIRYVASIRRAAVVDSTNGGVQSWVSLRPVSKRIHVDYSQAVPNRSPDPTRYSVFLSIPDPTRFSFENHQVAGNNWYFG